MASATQVKNDTIEKLRVLLDVAGIATSWDEIREGLSRMPVKVITALVYRVERARAQAFDEGREHSDGTVPETVRTAHA